jgi:hypothetical protein
MSSQTAITLPANLTSIVGNTVLNYAISTNPDPLQVSSPATITLVASKVDRRTITCNEITLKVVYSQDQNSEDALTANVESIGVSPPPNWTTANDGAGSFTFTPQPGYGTIQPDDTLLFVLDDIQVNNQVGTTTLTLIEKVTITNSDGSQTPSTQTTTYQLGKFPQSFSVSELTATPNPPIISPGGSVTLSWNGSAGDYSLSYGGQTISNLPNVGAYPVSNLQTTTTFYLTVTADGGTATLQRQCTVTVLQPSISQFGIVGHQGGGTSKFVVGSTFQLYWNTDQVDHCQLFLNGVAVPGADNLPANSDGYTPSPLFAQPGDYSFTLAAFGKNGGGGPTMLLPFIIYTFKVLPNPLAIPAGSPSQILVSPDGSRLYIGGTSRINNQQNASCVVSTVDNTVVKTLPGALNLSLSPDGSRLYSVPPNVLSSITSFDTSSFEANSISSIQGSYAAVLSQATVSADGKYLVVVSIGSSGGVQVYDCANNYSLVKNAPYVFANPASDANPAGLTIVENPKGNQFIFLNNHEPVMCSRQPYSYDLEQNTVSVLFGTDYSETDFLLFSPDETHYFFTHGGIFSRNISDGTVSVVYIPDSSDYLQAVLDPDGQHLFVLCPNLLAWIDMTNLNPEGYSLANFTIPLTNLPCGGSPSALAADPNRKVLYMTSTAGHLYQIDICGSSAT